MNLIYYIFFSQSCPQRAQSEGYSMVQSVLYVKAIVQWWTKEKCHVLLVSIYTLFINVVVEQWLGLTVSHVAQCVLIAPRPPTTAYQVGQQKFV